MVKNLDNISIWVNYALAHGTSYGKIHALVDAGLMRPPPELVQKKTIPEPPPGMRAKVCGWCGDEFLIDLSVRNAFCRKYCCENCSRLSNLKRIRLARNSTEVRSNKRTGRKK